jgi:hypothetical protein
LPPDIHGKRAWKIEHDHAARSATLLCVPQFNAQSWNFRSTRRSNFYCFVVAQQGAGRAISKTPHFTAATWSVVANIPGQKPHPPHQASLRDVERNACAGTRLNAGSANAWTNWTAIGWKAVTPTEQSGSANVYAPQMVVDPTLPVRRQLTLVRCCRYQTSSEGALPSTSHSFSNARKTTSFVPVLTLSDSTPGRDSPTRQTLARLIFRLQFTPRFQPVFKIWFVSSAAFDVYLVSSLLNLFVAWAF